MSSGYSRWLTTEEITNLMESFLRYDVRVENYPDIKKDQIWYGIRLLCFKKDYPKYDNIYYFKDKETRDIIRNYWENE
jgi:hypothetical protein